MKTKSLLLILVLLTALFVGCAGEEPAPAPDETPQVEEPDQEQEGEVNNPPETTPDVMTTASIVDTQEAFEKAISAENGTWIICTLTDLEFNKELVLDGEYKNGKKDDDGNDVIQRKIALYTQDEDRNVTNRYTLTAPKLTINSPNARIQSGTFVGDLYVSANNFQLVDAKVDGNVYFTTEEAQSTFTMDENSEVTGEQQMEE